LKLCRPMHVSSSTTALAAASFYSQNPAIAACSALTGQYPAHRFRLASHRHAIRADGRNKAQGSLVGTDGTAKGWLRIGVSDNEILFRRPDFCPAWHSWVRSLRLPPLGRLRPAARDRPRAECRRGSAAQGPKIRSRIDSRSLWTENSPGSLRSPQLRVGRRGRVSSQRRFRFESGHVGAGGTNLLVGRRAP